MVMPYAAPCFLLHTMRSSGVNPEEWLRSFYEHYAFRVQNGAYYSGMSSWQFYSCLLADSFAAAPPPYPLITCVIAEPLLFSTVHSNELWDGGTCLRLPKLKPGAQRLNFIVNVGGYNKLDELYLPAWLGTGTSRWRGRSVFAYTVSTPRMQKESPHS